MLGRWACIVLAALLAVPMPAAADWLMVGHDARQTGNAEGKAPSWDDVALQVQFYELGRVWRSEPILAGDFVYVAYLNPEVSTAANAHEYILVRVGLLTGIGEELARTTLAGAVSQASDASCFVPELASDGEQIFILAGSHVATFHLATMTFGAPIPLGLADVGAAAEVDVTTGCDGRLDRMVVSDGKLYVASGARSTATMRVLRLFEIDLATYGVRSWVDTIRPPAGTEIGESQDRIFKAVDPFFLIAGLAVADGRAVIVARLETYNQAAQSTLDRGVQYMSHSWSVDTKTNEAWARTGWSGATDFVVAPALLTEGYLFTKASGTGIQLRDPETGVDFLGNPLIDSGDRGSGFAWSNGRLFAAVGHRMYGLDANLQPFWEEPADLGGLVWQPGGLVVVGDTVMGLASTGEYTATAGSFAPSVLYAFNASTGALRWKHPLGGEATLLAGDGIAVTLDYQGTFTVFGTLPISLQPKLSVSGLYPKPGQTVTVDLGQTPPSALGGVQEVKADWGDGQVDEWRAGQVLQHSFGTATTTTARFYLRNAANQTASITQQFFVGQHDPAVNIFNSPFTDEYQNTSFFILGLLGTAAVALFGIARAGRKRRRLHKELRELEGDYDRLQSDSQACDHMLATRKARARSLFLERKLEEAHASFLTGRIDELRRNLRLGTVDARLKFLPHGMVLQLQRLLADTRIDEYERDHFVAALEQENSLTKHQKIEVAKVIDSWFARDVGRQA